MKNVQRLIKRVKNLEQTNRQKFQRIITALSYHFIQLFVMAKMRSSRPRANYRFLIQIAQSRCNNGTTNLLSSLQ